MSSANANKRLAVNTVYLYLRKLLTIVIGLYTSRALLQLLGIDDLGLYGLVGSVVVLFASFRGLFSSSIQRFINFELGRGNTDRVNEIFSMGMKIQIFIALGFMLLAEIGGLIMIPDLNIPKEDVTAAYLILQFSILSSMVSVLTVPFDALIIAHEKFNAFAVISVVESLLKLAVVFLLYFNPFERVVYYAFLLFLVALTVRVINAIYCRRTFGGESRFRNVRNPALMKEMAGFAGWQFLGNFGFTASNAGVNFVLNLFGGVAINGVRTIALQAMSMIEGFVNDVNTSFRPQIVSSYSSGNVQRFSTLSVMSLKISYALTAMMGFVVLCLTEPLLQLWLGQVPAHAVAFVKAILLYAAIKCIHPTFDIMYKASGNIRFYQICEAVCLFMNIPLSWLVLHFGAPLYSVFFVMAAMEMVDLAIISMVSRTQLGVNINQSLAGFALRMLLSVGVSVGIWLLLERWLTLAVLPLWQLLLMSAACVVIALFTVLLIMFSPGEIAKLKQTILSK